MKKDKLPDCFRKSKLLNDSKLPAEKLISFGEMFLRAGFFYDAAEFFRKASYTDGMKQLRDLAVEQGDSFLLGIALRGSDEQENTGLWEALGKKAMELKKYSHAHRAFKMAGNEALLKQAAEAFRSLTS